MMTRKITIIALIAGIVLGAAATETFNIYRQSLDSYRQSHESRVFQERLHCKAVADAYVKENSTDLKENPTDPSAVVWTLNKVDYSPARNSCVAEVEETNYFKGEHWYLKACKTCFRVRLCSQQGALKTVKY